MALCVRCSNSDLLQTRWEKLQPTGDEPKVVHSWVKAESSPKCPLCQLVEHEFEASDADEEIYTIVLFIELFLTLISLKDKPPSMKDISTMLSEKLPRSKSVQHDGLDPQPSSVPSAAPHAYSGQYVSRHSDDNVTASHGNSLRQKLSLYIIRSRESNHSPPKTDEPAPTSSSEVDLWEQARALVASGDSPDDSVDQYCLDQIVVSMGKTLAQHGDSQNCLVCKCFRDAPSFEELRLTGNQLTRKISDSHWPQRHTIFKNHLPPPDPRLRLKLGQYYGSHIEKVDFVLERREHWSAVRLQEFYRDEKALQIRGLREHYQIFPADRDSQSISASSAAPVESDLEAAPETALRKTYSQQGKDVCVLVPFKEGQHGFARQVKGHVDVDVIKLWLSSCEKRHDLCSGRNKEACPPGLILIDAERMCLVQIASHNPVRYIALSYVWGNYSQPTLTKAVLEAWMSQGQLHEVEVPQTIRDAIQLVQRIGYRYIWVDALCIVQDDAASRHGQISQMHEIYRHADMTVVAAGGNNCAAGLPGVTLANEREYKHRRYELPGLCLMKVPSSTKHRVETSPWRTRGWTFQEELCSRRTLVLLPEVMFFSCASAVWREDLELEAEDTIQGSEEGLMSLASMLHQKSPGDDKELLMLFRDLVKKYMQRTLSRTDDMENAFAGVSGILESLIGPAYHGIPEHIFNEVVHGCWFWDTSLQRREGFPSWSWTGWVYRQEQADIGIQPSSTAAKTSRLLTFYKVEPTGIQNLGPSGLAGSQGGEFQPRTDFELRSHFIPNYEELKSGNEALQYGEDVPSGLIAFYTSFAFLRVRTPPGDSVGLAREYRVCHPIQTNRHLTSIRLNVSYVAEKGNLLPFIVVDHDADRRSFRLMLIQMEGNTVERVNVTSQSRLVKEDDWKNANPQRQLFFMS